MHEARACHEGSSRWSALLASLALVLVSGACRKQTVVDWPAFTGLGLGLARSTDGWDVRFVAADGPAALAGMRAGDRVVALDDMKLMDMAAADIAKLVASRGGATIALDVRTADGAQSRKSILPGVFHPSVLAGGQREPASGDSGEGGLSTCPPEKMSDCACPPGCEGNACGNPCFLVGEIHDGTGSVCEYDCGSIECDCFLIV